MIMFNNNPMTGKKTIKEAREKKPEFMVSLRYIDFSVIRKT
jgi:hypothetical protein